MAVYFASKAFVLSLSEALHTSLCRAASAFARCVPGPVPTEFQARAGLTGDSRPDIMTKSAEWVAEQGYRGLRDNKRVVIPGFLNKIAAMADPALAARLVMGSLDRHYRKRDL